MFTLKGKIFICITAVNTTISYQKSKIAKETLISVDKPIKNILNVEKRLDTQLFCRLDMYKKD